MGAGPAPRTRRVAVVALAAVLALMVGVATAGGGQVKAKDFSFKPGKIVIQKGHKVTWKRIEGRHTVTLKNGSFDKILSKNHPKVSLRFNKRGTFRYYCRFHRALGMTGKVVVR